MAKNKKSNFTKIYEVNDLFAVAGYSLVSMGLLNYAVDKEWLNLTIEVIPVDSIVDVFSGLFNFDASGNIASLLIGVVAVGVEKYVKYKRLW